MNFVTGLPVSTDWNCKNYKSILVIVDFLTKMVYYKPVKVIDVVVYYHGIPKSIVIDQGLLFISKI